MNILNSRLPKQIHNIWIFISIKAHLIKGDDISETSNSQEEYQGHCDQDSQGPMANSGARSSNM